MLFIFILFYFFNEISSQSQESFLRSKSVRIQFPYDVFSPNSKDWRKERANYNELIVKEEEKIDYSVLSKAQDYEDVWLYENWFYGMENGIIMESGALDGITYSTSFFFENYLKWTPIHIGNSSFLFLFIISFI